MINNSEQAVKIDRHTGCKSSSGSVRRIEIIVGWPVVEQIVCSQCDMDAFINVLSQVQFPHRISRIGFLTASFRRIAGIVVYQSGQL